MFVMPIYTCRVMQGRSEGNSHRLSVGIVAETHLSMPAIGPLLASYRTPVFRSTIAMKSSDRTEGRPMIELNETHCAKQGQSNPVVARAMDFAKSLGLRVPILLAPMAGACPASLSVAVCNAGGMGACGALLMSPGKIGSWVDDVRDGTDGTDGKFQLNTWVPDPEPMRDAEHELSLKRYLRQWEMDMGASADSVEWGAGQGNGSSSAHPQPIKLATEDFAAQCKAMIEARPAAISSIMGLYPAEMVLEMKRHGIQWFATITTVEEAVLAERAGADVIVAQGMEAGGHRGAFHADDAERAMVGLFSLLPAVTDAVDVPVVATGGIADARGMAAALMLGASAVQVGTGFLRAAESSIAPAWANAIAEAAPENTAGTRAFSGRLGRSIRTRYVDDAARSETPSPAPYPVQRALTARMRQAASASENLDGMQAWAGQSARLAKALPAADIVNGIWQGVRELIPDINHS